MGLFTRRNTYSTLVTFFKNYTTQNSSYSYQNVHFIRKDYNIEAILYLKKEYDPYQRNWKAYENMQQL